MRLVQMVLLCKKRDGAFLPRLKNSIAVNGWQRPTPTLEWNTANLDKERIFDMLRSLDEIAEIPTGFGRNTRRGQYRWRNRCPVRNRQRRCTYLGNKCDGNELKLLCLPQSLMVPGEVAYRS